MRGGGELKKKDRFHKSCKELEVSSMKINIPKIQIGQFKEAEIGGGGILEKGWIGKKGRSGWVEEGDGGLANFRPLLVWQFQEPPQQLQRRPRAAMSVF